MNKKIGFIILVLGIMAYKWSVYYSLVQTPGGFALPVALTLVFSVWAFLAFQKLFGKKGGWLFFGLYTIISLIFLVDVVYFKQFNARASIRLLNQAGAVGDVKESIKQIISIRHFTGLLDLPFLAGLIAYLQHHQAVVKLKYRYLTILPILIALMMVVTPFRSAYAEAVAKREFFSFHVQDIVKSVMTKEEIKVEDVDILSEITYRNKKYTDLETLSKGQYWGIGKGKNLIVIQLESFQDFVVNRTYNGVELTPNINKLIKDNSLYYPNYYQQVGMGNTSDAEFTTQNSAHSTVYGQSYALYTNNTFKGLPWQMRDQGYTSLAFHGYKPDFWSRDKAYPAQGFERFYSEGDYTITEPIGFGLNDFEFFEQNIKFLKEQTKPTYGFMITLSNHHPYKMPKTHLKVLPEPEHVGTLFGDYVNSIHYTDAAVGYFIEQLKANGLYDNTVIALYGDHHGLVRSDEESDKIMTKLLGKQYRLDEMLNVPLIIHVPGSGVQAVREVIGSQIDFMPTILNIMGIQNKNLLIFGKDLNNTTENLAAFQIYAPFGSFITDQWIFEMSNDYIFENGNAFDRLTGEPIDKNLCLSTYNAIVEEWKKSKFILDQNLLTNADQYVGEKFQAVFSSGQGQLTPGAPYIPIGGAPVNGMSGTQSLEGLNAALESQMPVIQLNFKWTSDKEVVVMTDWETASKGAEKPIDGKTFHDFMAAKMENGLTQLSLRRVLDWLSAHDEALILADAGEQHLEFANYIYKNYPDAKNRFIYKVDQLDDFRRLGYLNETFVLLDASQMTLSTDQLIQFAKDNKPYGILLKNDQLTPEAIKSLKLVANVYMELSGGLVKQ